MSAQLEAFHDEHQHLLPHIHDLRSSAERVGLIDRAEFVHLLDNALEFLESHLIPHARAEDAVLYKYVADALGHERATATMQRDHVEVLRLTQELRFLRHHLDVADTESVEQAKRLLYGLHAIITLHFAKEEEVYIPLLESHLDQEQADALLQEMGRAHRTE